MKIPMIPSEIVWNEGNVPEAKELPPFAIVLQWVNADTSSNPQYELANLPCLLVLDKIEPEEGDPYWVIENPDGDNSNMAQEDIRKGDYWAFVGVYDIEVEDPV